jgi:hypothetical protein
VYLVEAKQMGRGVMALLAVFLLLYANATVRIPSFSARKCNIWNLFAQANRIIYYLTSIPKVWRVEVIFF